MLIGRDAHLARSIETTEFTIAARDGYSLPIRAYIPTGGTSASRNIIYYHGGGLKVGDLDSEDLSCRRIAIEAACNVYSVDYRLTPENEFDVPVEDAWDAFVGIAKVRLRDDGLLVVVGSSSGGQLAAQVSQMARNSDKPKKIDGLILRCPVTVNSYDNGSRIPARFRHMHTSWSSSFETSLLHMDEGNTSSAMPLEANTFEDLPPTFLQICTNDVYYSDGVCYAEALATADVPVKVDVIEGWPHTFWLKAPQLETALRADGEMIEGLKWLLRLSSSE